MPKATYYDEEEEERRPGFGPAIRPKLSQYERKSKLSTTVSTKPQPAKRDSNDDDLDLWASAESDIIPVPAPHPHHDARTAAHARAPADDIALSLRGHAAPSSTSSTMGHERGAPMGRTRPASATSAGSHRAQPKVGGADRGAPAQARAAPERASGGGPGGGGRGSPPRARAATGKPASPPRGRSVTSKRGGGGSPGKTRTVRSRSGSAGGAEKHGAGASPGRPRGADPRAQPHAGVSPRASPKRWQHESRLVQEMRERSEGPGGGERRRLVVDLSDLSLVSEAAAASARAPARPKAKASGSRSPARGKGGRGPSEGSRGGSRPPEAASTSPRLDKWQGDDREEEEREAGGPGLASDSFTRDLRALMARVEQSNEAAAQLALQDSSRAAPPGARAAGKAGRDVPAVNRMQERQRQERGGRAAGPGGPEAAAPGAVQGKEGGERREGRQPASFYTAEGKKVELKGFRYLDEGADEPQGFEYLREEVENALGRDADPEAGPAARREREQTSGPADAAPRPAPEGRPQSQSRPAWGPSRQDAEMEAQLEREAAALREQMSSLQEKQLRVELQAEELRLRKLSASYLEQFEVSLRVELEEKVRWLLEEKRAKVEACEGFQRELEDHIERLQESVKALHEKMERLNASYETSMTELQSEYTGVVTGYKEKLERDVRAQLNDFLKRNKGRPGPP